MLDAVGDYVVEAKYALDNVEDRVAEESHAIWLERLVFCGFTCSKLS